MIDEFKKIVKRTTEDEAKSLLLQTLIRIHMAEEKGQYSNEQLLIDLKRTYADFVRYKRNETKKENNSEYNTAHIVFGDSPSGSLKMALKDSEEHQDERVINFSDMFSVGPVWRLHADEGIRYRHDWIENHLITDEDYIHEYQDKFNQTLLNIDSIPAHSSIFIWAGENADEQTALRYVLYLLKEKTNQIFLVNTTQSFKQQFDTPECEHFPLHTGQIAPDKLRVMYEGNRNVQKLTRMQRNVYEEKWEALSAKQEVLRVWEKHEIRSVDETFYDDYIIQTAEKIHRERKNDDFMKSARLIGEVIGHSTQYTGDEFLEYRVRQLILNGVFEMKGVPKAMRFYSVRLKSI